MRNEPVTRIRRISIESRAALNTYFQTRQTDLSANMAYVRPALPGFAWDPSGSRAANHEMV